MGSPHSDARWLHVQIKASAGGIDVVKQGFIYVPPAAFSPSDDLDGNLTEDEQWEYAWGAENRMTSATQKDFPIATGLGTANTPPARKKLTFAYDYRNRRIAKRVFQLETSNLEPETSTWKLVKDLRFVYDGYQMIAELDHSFATGTGLEGSRVNRTFLWGPDVSGTMTGAGGVGGLLCTTYQGVTYHVCSDANGNVTGLVPGSGPQAGTLIARYDYDPFGNRITNTGPDVDLCPFGFSTKYTDSETGIVHYDLLDYSPPLGRFMCGDPIGERGGVNLYGFVGNDAVNEWDYLGLWSPEAHNELIRDALQDRMSDADLGQIMLASQAFDQETQDPAYAPWHYMRAGRLQTVRKSLGILKDFVQNKLEHIWCNECGGNHADAVRIFGELLHPLMDSSSPMHRDATSGDPLPWEGILKGGPGHSPWEGMGRETKAHITDSVRAYNKNVLRVAHSWAFRVSPCHPPDTDAAATSLMAQLKTHVDVAPPPPPNKPPPTGSVPYYPPARP